MMSSREKMSAEKTVNNGTTPGTLMKAAMVIVPRYESIF